MFSTPLPAILGGPPVRPQGPPSWPLPDEEILQAIQAAYRDGSWGKYHGGHVERLEHELGKYHSLLGTQYLVLSCSSGTCAVELGLRALKIQAGDEVIMAAYDYPGNFLSVHAVGAHPVLIDVAPHNWNLDPGRIEEAVGPKTKAILVSHLHGGVVPMGEVSRIARERGLFVIEDAAQMPGALIEGRRAGTWGDVGILSFGGSKLLTAGRGGAILTRHPDVFQRAKLWQNRGNVVCPLSELQAAVLLPQLAKLDDGNAHRRASVGFLLEKLNDIPGLHPFTTHDSPFTNHHSPAFYKLGWQFDSEQFGLSRERLLQAMRAEGIALDEGFRALHLGRSPSRFRQSGDLTEAAKAHAGTIILHHPILLGGEAEVEEVERAFRKMHEHVGDLAR